MSLQNTPLNVAPYFDDYDEAKNYHRILFRPRTVQARELNQLQSITQDQINRFGKHIFQEGAIVIPGGVSVKTDQECITLFFNPGFSINDVLNHNVKLFAKSKSTGATALIRKIIPMEGADPITFFLEYVSGGDAGTAKKFAEAEDCFVYTQTSDGIETPISEFTVIELKKGILAKAIEGVYFVRGYFVRGASEDVVVSKYSTDINAKIGFLIKEQIVSENQDSTLYSNALGEPNFKAPGAARLKISLQLTSQNLNVENADFIEMIRLEAGVIRTIVADTNYSIIEQSIARRTFETHGNYTVYPFGIRMKNHLKEDTQDNDGVFLAADGGLESKFVAEIKPGIAYVNGYRVENTSFERVEMDRARDTQTVLNSVTSIDYGPYVIVENISSLPDIDVRKKLRLLDALDVVIGTASIRSIARETVDKYRLYLFNFNFVTGKKLENATKIDYQDANNLFTADLDTTTLFDASKDCLIFPLSQKTIQTLKPGGVGRTSFGVYKSFVVQTNAVGVASITVSTNEIFKAPNNFEFFVAYTGSGTTGDIIEPADIDMSLSGSPLGRVLIVDLGVEHANQNIKIIAPVIKTIATERTKTLKTTTENLTVTDSNVAKLSKVDVVNIISAIDKTDITKQEDWTELFFLNDGQSASWYDVGSLETFDDRNVTSTNLEVTYQYFEHGTGDFFSIDSYSGIDRDIIPFVDTPIGRLPLTDVIDFRPSRQADGDFSTSSTSDIVRSGEMIRADVVSYLDRIDILYVTGEGKFMSAKGISKVNPTPPMTPAGCMKIYELYIPAYTHEVDGIGKLFIENRRYTMRDIGIIDKRLDNVEYYTSLSMLEKSANYADVLDPATGNSRFKNGFAADGFIDFRLADINDPKYKAALDYRRGLLLPTFTMNSVDLIPVTESDVSKNKNFFTLPYTEVKIIDQPYATKTSNINPYAVFTWTGTLELTPNKDFWKDVVYLQPINN